MGYAKGLLKSVKTEALLNPTTLFLGYELEETQCDGVDSDCDGFVDESLTPPPAEASIRSLCRIKPRMHRWGATLSPTIAPSPTMKAQNYRVMTRTMTVMGRWMKAWIFIKSPVGWALVHGWAWANAPMSGYSKCTPGAPATTDECDRVDNDCDRDFWMKQGH